MKRLLWLVLLAGCVHGSPVEPEDLECKVLVVVSVDTASVTPHTIPIDSLTFSEGCPDWVRRQWGG